jgi:hypothetical protein
VISKTYFIDKVARDLFAFIYTKREYKTNFAIDLGSMALVRIEEEKMLRQRDFYVWKIKSEAREDFTDNQDVPSYVVCHRIPGRFYPRALKLFLYKVTLP